MTQNDSKRFVYLDNNATTAIAPEVVDAMRPYFETKYWNPSSMYEPAANLARELDQARETVARELKAAAPDEIIFTSCATESNNAAIFGGLRAALKANPKRRHIITSKVEHPAVIEVCKRLEKDGGYEVDWIGVDPDGKINLREYVQALRPGETALVSIMHANNETGVVFPIERLARLAKQTDPKIVFHVDATQSITKLPIDLSRVETTNASTGGFGNVDMLSFSGHKIHAPKGVGALYVKRGTPFEPFLIGGHQERGRRAGTENVPYIMGLARALELESDSILERGAKTAAMRDRLQNELETQIPWIVVNGKGAPRTPNTLNVAVYGAEGEAILMLMSSKGVCVSSGSACTSGSLEPSHVLSAMQVPPGALQGNFRFSLSRYTTDEEIDLAIKAFVESVDEARKTSSKWDKAKGEPIA